MMGSKKRNRFKEIKENTACSRHMDCIGAAMRDMYDCSIETGRDALPCLECGPDNCEFIRTSDVDVICGCPLRNYIVYNFDSFIDDSIDRVRQKDS